MVNKLHEKVVMETKNGKRYDFLDVLRGIVLRSFALCFAPFSAA
jgi:hypothetical protein